jgi:hypothetical protein
MIYPTKNDAQPTEYVGCIVNSYAEKVNSYAPTKVPTELVADSVSGSCRIQYWCGLPMVPTRFPTLSSNDEWWWSVGPTIHLDDYSVMHSLRQQDKISLHNV